MIAIIVAVLGNIAAVAGDIVAARLGAGRVKCYVLSLLTGLAATFVAIWYQQLALPDAIIALLLYGAWWFAFLNLIQSLHSSLRVRLLYELRAAGGSMPMARLQQIYNDDLIVRMRLARLQSNGSVVERTGRLHVRSASLMAVVGTFRLLKIALLGRPSEFGEKP
ncbi:hypothetical protein [Ferrovibrio xuzhouensis]|uniref:Uncharacterized protein n=1 Tax=Ferrovibrio xuzhouensis TaxID=1576914 RepID=A0ABV7VBM7_9PROT